MTVAVEGKRERNAIRILEFWMEYIEVDITDFL